MYISDLLEILAGPNRGTKKDRAARKKLGAVHSDDDFIDRLSHRYTVLILALFALVVTLAHWVGDLVTCWAPVHFTDNHIKYADSYCWVRNTYYLPFDREIPRPDDRDNEHAVIYYQWIPFILVGQAILFYIPTEVWHRFNDRAGVDSDDILSQAETLTMIPLEDAIKGDKAAPDFPPRNKQIAKRSANINLIVRAIDMYLTQGTGKEWKNGEVRVINDKKVGPGFWSRVRNCHPPWHKRFGSYLVLLYILSKILFVANVIGQMFLMNHWLGFDYNLFGINMATNMANIGVDQDWTDDAFVAFPRVTMCDFTVRRLGNLHRYTLQCVLPINMYIEKIYMFLWFWFCLLAILSILSLITWIVRFASISDKVKFVKKHLTSGGRLSSGRMSSRRPLSVGRDRPRVERFVSEYLGQDGAFLLRLVAHNTDYISVTEVTCALFDKWLSWVNLIQSDIEAETQLLPVTNPLQSAIEAEEEISKDQPRKD